MFPFIREHWELPYGEFSPDSIGRKVGRTSAHLPRKGVIKIHGFTPVSFIYNKKTAEMQQAVFLLRNILIFFLLFRSVSN